MYFTWKGIRRLSTTSTMQVNTDDDDLEANTNDDQVIDLVDSAEETEESSEAELGMGFPSG